MILFFAPHIDKSVVSFFSKEYYDFYILYFILFYLNDREREFKKCHQVCDDNDGYK
jgi:uncharacterized membrane protein